MACQMFGRLVVTPSGAWPSLLSQTLKSLEHQQQVVTAKFGASNIQERRPFGPIHQRLNKAQFCAIPVGSFATRL